MTHISFKFRPNGATAQLVRHRYDPRIKRSRAVPVGTLDRRVDPTALPEGIALRAGETLSPEDLARIGQWLGRHGDPVAAARRRAQEARMEARIRAQVQAELSPQSDPFDCAERALTALARSLPELAHSQATNGEQPPWSLRPRYLEVRKAWDSVFEAARAAGLTVTRRTQPGGDGAPEEA